MCSVLLKKKWTTIKQIWTLLVMTVRFKCQRLAQTTYEPIHSAVDTKKKIVKQLSPEFTPWIVQKKTGQDKHSVVKHYISLTDKLHNSRPVWRQGRKRRSEKTWCTEFLPMPLVGKAVNVKFKLRLMWMSSTLLPLYLAWAGIHSQTEAH